jgi:hypothetical protein
VLSETLTREVSLPLRRAFIAVLAVVMLAAAPAAAVPRAGTTVVVSLKTPAFHGTLNSSKAACKSNRTVRLFKVKRGPDRLLMTGTSNGKGKWSTPVGKQIRPGSYYVKAVARGNCKAGKSKTLVIPG